MLNEWAMVRIEVGGAAYRICGCCRVLLFELCEGIMIRKYWSWLMIKEAELICKKVSDCLGFMFLLESGVIDIKCWWKMAKMVLKIIKWTRDTFSGVGLRWHLGDWDGVWVEGVSFENTDLNEGSWRKIFIQPSNN
jgi:hypothetical protein